MNKKYVKPIIDVACCRSIESLANDNFLSDPWGFEDEMLDSDESEEE